MNLFTRTLSKIFKSSNQQELDKIQNLIQSINSKEKDLKTLSEADFKERTLKFKKVLKMDYLMLTISSQKVLL